MDVEVRFNQGIITGDDVRDLLKVFPELETKFKQRKHYDEYYFDEKVVELNIENLKKLSGLFKFEMYSNNLKILL